MRAPVFRPTIERSPMSVLAPIANAAPELEAIFKDLHAHPELGFQEVRTSAVVAETLKAYGVD